MSLPKELISKLLQKHKGLLPILKGVNKQQPHFIFLKNQNLLTFAKPEALACLIASATLRLVCSFFK